MSEKTLAKELCDKGFTSGFAEVRRLVHAGAIRVNGKTATLWNMNVEPGDVITVGKHKKMVVKQ